MVELLVVIGIMAILIAILLPVLSRARYKAREVACASNLRQIGALLTGYAADNQGWYPKNGAIRNHPFSLKNGNVWDIAAVMKKYQRDAGRDIWRCPLVLPEMVNTNTQSSYTLMFDTWNYMTSPNSPLAYTPLGTTMPGDPGTVPHRPMQYNIAGQPVWPGPPGLPSVNATTLCPYLDERKLMRRLGQTWTSRLFNSSAEHTFNMLAGDRVYLENSGPGESNHPDPRARWQPNGPTWRGVSSVTPFTTANYLHTDGSVFKHSFSRSWTTGAVRVAKVEFVPREMIVR